MEREWRKRGWTCIRFDACDGHGLVHTYADPYGQDAECKDCGGSGHLWRSPKGALAQYPGGPFLGKETIHVTA